MSILLWITIEMEYKMKCLNFNLFFTNGRQKLTAKGLSQVNSFVTTFVVLPTELEWSIRNFVLRLDHLTFDILIQCPCPPYLVGGRARER